MKPWAWAGWGVLVAVVFFGSGWLVGRQMPAHKYEKFAPGGILLDISTGRVCSAWPASNPVDQAITGEKDSNGFSVVKTVPPCSP